MNLDTDKIVCALITIAADGNSGKTWDLLEDYFRAMDEMRQQKEERNGVRQN